MMSHSEAPRTGAELRAARESHGWTLDEVAAGLRIRRPFLKALEEGRASDLPGFAYAVGFLRTYAQALGLDAEEMARRFRAEAGGTIACKTRLVFPEPVPERGVPAGAVVLLALVLGIGGYIGWHRYSARDVSTADVVPPVPARLEEAAARPGPDRAVVPPAPRPPADAPPVTLALPSPTTAAPMTPDREAAPPVTATAGAETGRSGAPAPGIAARPDRAPQAADPAPGDATATTLAPDPQPQAVAIAPASPVLPTAPPPVVVIPAPVIPPASAAAAVPPPAAAPVDRVVIRAQADAWINIRGQGGQVLLNRVLKAGESWTAPDADLAGLTMITGNAGGTEIVLDGEPLAALGNNGAVRRDIPLDPERLRALAPPRGAQPDARQPAPSGAQ